VRMSQAADDDGGHAEPDLTARIARALERNNDLLAEQVEISRKLLWELQTNRRTQDVLRLLATSAQLDDVQAFAQSRQLGFMETVEALRAEGLGFARFGDGEFRLMLRAEYKLKFQPNSAELAAELAAVLSGTAVSRNMLVGFPHVYRDVHWSGVWSDIWGQLKPMVDGIPRVGNSHVTRPIFFQLTGDRGVAAWRSVWEGRHVTVVTGKGSRFDLTPALFDNLASVDFEYSTPVDAFADVTRLVDALRSRTSDLVLIALGPAGTVLAARLASAGVRAIDVGHISDSYENVFRGGAWPEEKKVVV